MFQAFTNGVLTTCRNIQLWILLYVINLLFAGLVIVPLGYYVGNTLAYSKATDRLLNGFDFTLFNDFINQYKSFPQLFSMQTFIVGGLFIVLYIFLSGGLLRKFSQPTISGLKVFWEGCGQYFWRMFRLTIYFLLVHIGIAILFLILFSFLTKGGLTHFRNESAIYNRAVICLLLYGVIASVFFMIHDYAKVMVVQHDRRFIIKDFITAFRFCFSRLISVYGLYLLNTISFVIVAYIYFQLNQIISEDKAITLLSFLLGQCFVFLQIGFKLLNLSSATAMYRQTIEKEY